MLEETEAIPEFVIFLDKGKLSFKIETASANISPTGHRAASCTRAFHTSQRTRKTSERFRLPEKPSISRRFAIFNLKLLKYKQF